LILASGCSEGNFAAGVNRAMMQRDKILIPGTDSSRINQAFEVKNGELEIYFEPGDRVAEAGNKSKIPLTIYFVIDKTGSMLPVIEAIKNNINQLVNQLQEKGFDPLIGAVTFSDVVEASFSLTSDVESFKAFMGRVDAKGGGDANEASLAATEFALQRIGQQDSRSDSLRALLVITDNPGHRGGNSVNRDCRINETVNAFNSVYSGIQKNYKLYHSMAPTGWKRSLHTRSSVRECGGFQSGREQFNQILNQISTDVPLEERGSEVGWPLTANTLLDEFAGKLEKITTGKDLLCLAESAILEVGGKNVSSWQGQQLTATYREYREGKKLKLPDLLRYEEVQQIKQQGGTLRVQRCCILAVEKGVELQQECVSRKEQKVDFKIIFKT
jgi:hypothetical protein